eukprot:GFUD01009990.1.p1 GENE.GFUD01009990.1~~GFUD01009990.1.p1  ORF type:complete len:295 (+),score=66.70 GFUD01009990.1:88-972(+)
MAELDAISYEKVLEAATFIEDSLTSQNIIFQPKLGIICGTGLGVLGHVLKQVIPPIPYSTIPNFPHAAIPGHDGQLLIGNVGDIPLVVFQGRVHTYQGFSLAETAFPARLLKLLGVSKVLITNVSGGINKEYKVGDFVLIKDHINFAGLGAKNPLAGTNDPRFGPRYFPIVDAYSRTWREKAEKVGKEMGESVHQGVYAVVGGPNFESVAEVRMLRMMGADVVGMSTVAEVLTAVHAGMEVLALSLVTNMCVDDYEQRDEQLEGVGWVAEVIDKRKVNLLEFVTKLVLASQDEE